MRWLHFQTRDSARRYARWRPLVDDIDVTFDQPGWYWCERVDDPIGDCLVSHICRIIPAAQRVAELREQMKELASELRVARTKLSAPDEADPENWP